MTESLPIAILAGGLATRLRPITEKIPKSLVTVGGKSFLEHQLELLRRNGVRKIVLCVGYLGEMIEVRYGNGRSLGVEISYSYDGANLLGTGGAIRKALPLLGPSFFVLYGDSYLPIRYNSVADAFVAAGRPALMTVFQNQDAWDKSNVWFETGQIRLYSKRRRLQQMRHIDYGLTVCSQSIFDDWKNEEAFDISAIFESLSEKDDLAGFEVFERFYEVGSPSGLAELDDLLSNTRIGAEK